MKKNLIFVFVIATLCGWIVPAASAQDTELKQRMERRLPTLDELRLRQVVGENNTGYLEVRGVTTPAEDAAVAAENADRASVYELIARRSETTKEAVGRARAKAIAAASARGVLVQDASGNWAPKR